MAEIQECMAQFRDIEGVPIVSQLRSAGSFGLAGSRGLVDDVARGMVLQLVGLHSPAEVVLTAITSAQSKERWEWLQWLPHVGSGHSPLSGDHLAAGPAGGSALLSRLEDLIDQREAASQTPRPALRPGVDPLEHATSRNRCCPPCWWSSKTTPRWTAAGSPGSWNAARTPAST